MPSNKHQRGQAKAKAAHTLAAGTAEEAHQELLDSAQRLIDRGHAALAANKPREAMALFERARARGLSFTSVEDALAVERIVACNMANAHHALGNWEQCVEEHARSLQLAEQAGDSQHARKERGNLDVACLEAAKRVFELGKRAFDRGEVVASLTLHQRSHGYGRRMSDERSTDRLHVERVAKCNIGNALYRLGEFPRAVTAHKRCLKLALDSRDAQLAKTARDNLECALLAEVAERFELHNRLPDPLRLSDAEAAEAFAAEAPAEGELPTSAVDADPVVALTCDRFLRSPELQVAALIRSGVFEHRELAMVWVGRLREHMLESGLIESQGQSQPGPTEPQNQRESEPLEGLDQVKDAGACSGGAENVA